MFPMTGQIGTYEITDLGDRVQFHGVDVGDGMRPKRVVKRVAFEMREVIVVHVPGHNRWGDQLHPSVYEPASFLVLVKVDSTHVRPVVGFGVRP